MQNEDALFREATLRICGNLEIDQSLLELLLFLQEVMPIAKIFLQHCDDDYQAMRAIPDCLRIWEIELNERFPLAGFN